MSTDTNISCGLFRQNKHGLLILFIFPIFQISLLRLNYKSPIRCKKNYHLLHELVHFLKLIILFSFTLSTGRYLASLFLKAYQACSVQVGKYCIFQNFLILFFFPQMKALLSDSRQIHQHRLNCTETSKLINLIF